MACFAVELGFKIIELSLSGNIAQSKLDCSCFSSLGWIGLPTRRLPWVRLPGVLQPISVTHN